MNTKRTLRHPRRTILASALAASLMMLGSQAVIAQSSDATLRGKAAANADVTAKNVATGAMRRTKAGADGSYTLVGLQPGTYTIDGGPGTEKTVTLSVASTATLDLTSSANVPPPLTTTNLDGVTVTASTLREVKTSEVGKTISLQQINTIPQITRNFLEFADTVPGMVFSVDSSGHTKLQGGAQQGSSINVYIDGVGQKNYVLTGGVSGQDSSQGNPFPQLAIGEYKVITSNYKAEYDQIASAAVTAETKSGTNEFHGEILGTHTDSGWRDDTPAEKAAGKKPDTHEDEYGFALGGPIIQDALHFFVSYEGKNFVTPTVVVPGVLLPPGLLPADVESQAGPATLPFTEDLYFGKLDWEFSDRDRVELSSKVRQEKQRDNVQGAQTVSFGSNIVNNDTRIDLRWQHSADAWFNEVLLTYEDASYKPTPINSGNASVYTYQPNQDATILQVGGGQNNQDKGQKGPAFQDDLTFNDLNWMGDHVVKMGFKIKDAKLTAREGSASNPEFFYDVNPSGTATIPYKAVFGNPVSGLNPTATSDNKQFGTYIQDDWAVNDKLTLNLGVRWDYEKTPTFDGFVTPANVIAAYNSQDPNAPAGQTYAQSLAKGGVNINDYISNGHNRKAQKDEIQPRLGFSYDLNGDEDHVIYGGAGRAYDRDLFDYLQLEETKGVLPSYTVFFNDSSRTCTISPSCVQFDPKYLTGVANLQSLVSSTGGGREIDAINNNLKAPYSDQYSLGIRNKVGEWNTDVAVSRILSKDGFVFTLGNRYPDGGFFEGGSQPWGQGIPGFGSLIIGNNGIETKSTALLLSAEKPYTKDSGWGVTLAYTYTDAKENRFSGESNHYAFDEETINQYPFLQSSGVSKHRFVGTGTIDGFWGFTFATKVVLATPLPHGDIACYGITYPTGSNCTPRVDTPPGRKFAFGGDVFGTRDIDFQATKNFDLTRGINAYIRADLLNAFNFKNYSTVVTSYGSGGILNPNPAVYLTSGDISTPPRTFKLTMGLSF